MQRGLGWLCEAVWRPVAGNPVALSVEATEAWRIISQAMNLPEAARKALQAHTILYEAQETVQGLIS